MSGASVILSVDYGSDTFRKCFYRLPNNIKKDAKRAFGELSLLDLSAAPHKLHLHTLTGKKVPSVLRAGHAVSVYTIHITADDRYKASFTFEGGTAYMRACGEHDWLDKNP